MTATTTFQAGTIVKAPIMEGGKVVGHGRAVVLKLWNETDPSVGYIVRFYGAKASTALVFGREMKAVGKLEDMSERLLKSLVGQLYGKADGNTVWMNASVLLTTKRRERLAH